LDREILKNEFSDLKKENETLSLIDFDKERKILSDNK
jgi:hypothetical protein